MRTDIYIIIIRLSLF